MSVSTIACKGGATARRLGGGGRGPFEVDSFHATPIGIMLNVENIAGDRSPVPPVPPPMIAYIARGDARNRRSEGIGLP